jgi:predicted GNAT family N-acyltransferase
MSQNNTAGQSRKRRALRIERLPHHAADSDSVSEAYRNCLEIRRRVFVEGQDVPSEIEFDGLDITAEHFLAYARRDEESMAIATGRMRVVDDSGKIERIAVLEDARESGVGRAIMDAIEERAGALGLRSVRLNAQLQALPFYEKLGYRAYGDVFIEAGIDHRAMTKALSGPASD